MAKILLLSALGVVAAAIDVTVSQTVSESVSIVPGDFVGFGFEIAFLNSYDNEFSNNLVNSVASRMGKPPVIRLGGTSGDSLMFDPNQKENTTCVTSGGDCPNGSDADFILGPSYFDGLQSFANYSMTFQAPLNYPVNKTNVLEYVQRAYKALGPDRVNAIALGNEVAYHGHDDTPEEYVSNAGTIMEYISEALNLTGEDARIFQVLDMGSSTVDSGSPYTLQDAFEAGLNDNSTVKYAAEHFYQLGGGMDAIETDMTQLMNHTFTKEKFVNHDTSISYLNQNYPDVPYFLSETGSSLVGGLDLSGVFGDCLWSIDFQLYAITRGVARVAGTQRPVASHSLWIPVSGLPDTPGPSVRAPFIAQLFMADFIGKSNETRVTNLMLGRDFLSAYAAYEGTTLERVALVNLRNWSKSDGTERGNETFSIQVPKNVTSVRVETLSALTGTQARGFDLDPSENITWAGMQWSYKVDDGKGHQTTETSQTVDVNDGEALVTVWDSGAAIVYI